MMRVIRFFLFLSFVLGNAMVSMAAEWETTDVTVSSSSENATLAGSGRNAGVDPQGRIHLVFQKNLDGQNFQVLCTIRDVAENWGPPELVSLPGTNARNASAIVDQTGALHVVYEDISDGEGEITYRIRSASGVWNDPAFISPAAGFSRQPVLALDAFNQIHVVWVDGRQGIQRLLYSVAPEGGAWSPAQVLSVDGIAPQDPSIDADGVGAVHIAWTDRGTTDPDQFSYNLLYLKVDSGSSGSPNPVRLINHPGVALSPFIEALDDGTLHLVWLDDRTVSRVDALAVYYKRFLPGIGWGRDKRFTYDETDHGRPVIVAGGGNTLNVAWEDYRTSTPDIYYRQITFETGWDREPSQLTSDVSSSQAPTLIALNDGRIVLFWTDAQGSGTFQVFAKNGHVGAAP
jgi:hypothetical protein